MTKSGIKNTFLIAIAICVSSSVMAEKMFKWKDEKGVTHYTQTAPKDRTYEVIEVKQSDPRANGSYGNRQQRTISRQTRPVTPQVPKTDVERYKAARNNNCEKAKRNLNTLTTVARIRIPDGVGGERLLTDREKAEKVALTQEQVKTFCSKDNDLTRTPSPKPSQQP